MEQHFSHEHPLILNEVYIAKAGDVCRGCMEEIVSCRSFVYTCINNTSSDSKSSSSSLSSSSSSCVKFLLHKSCAELPPTIKHPNHHHVSLQLYSFDQVSKYSKNLFIYCSICGCSGLFWITGGWSGFVYACLDYKTNYDIVVCARCAMTSLEEEERSIYHQHPAHPHHALKLVHHLSSFRCVACKVDDNIRDLSYICTKCLSWVIHKSCADAPASFQFQFHHKHPLQLSFSLPQVHQKFPQYCRICSKQLRTSREWIYYCPKCRFFAHFHCARSNRTKRLMEDAIYDSDVVHLPAANETSADQLAEQFVMAMSTISTTNRLWHWAHNAHDLQLMTINELNINQKHDEEALLLLLLCDGCVKPIQTDQDNQFYGCVPCNYFMHNACAGLPREIEHHLQYPGITLYADKYSSSPLDFFYCDGCFIPTNGIAFHDGKKPLSRFSNNVHIGCLTLPKKIKHEAHNHQLNKVFTDEHACKACGAWNRYYSYRCEKCGYYICAGCIMLPKTIKHPWDPHPLSLIYDPGMVSSDHEHEFECEYCSKEIDTNNWFYHCSECDLSFHLLHYAEYCFERSRHSHFSRIKFGATVIIDKLHHHSLTYVLNKKVRLCEKCFESQLSKPVLECVPVKSFSVGGATVKIRWEEYNIGS